MEEIIYLDNEDNIVTSDKATHAILRKTNEKGELIEETFLDIRNIPQVKDELDEKGEITPEMEQVLNDFRMKWKKSNNMKG